MRKFNISNLVKKSDLNTKLVALARKAELKAKPDKIMKMETGDLNYVLGKIVFGDGDSPNIFLFQPTLNTLELKKDKGASYVLI